MARLKTAPEVDFPADVEADTGLPEHRIARSGRAGLVLLQVQALRTQLLQLWITPGLHDGQLGAGFSNAQSSHAQVGVVGIGLGNQRIQLRVGEYRPPLAQVGCCGAAPCLLQQWRAPAVQPRLVRLFEIGADLGAAGQHHQQAQATAAVGHGSGSRWCRLLRHLQRNPLPEQHVGYAKDHRADEQADDAFDHHAAQCPDQHHRIGTSTPRPSSSGLSTLSASPATKV